MIFTLNTTRPWAFMARLLDHGWHLGEDAQISHNYFPMHKIEADGSVRQLTVTDNVITVLHSVHQS